MHKNTIKHLIKLNKLISEDELQTRIKELGRQIDADYKGEEVIVTKRTVVGNTTTTTDKNFNSFGTVHPYVIMARIGFSF